ncbi:MAG: hypothetical protein KJP09_04645 [Bacteroidia bacterium]|nr:hypothetical protein [Bacteroidia bacterium]MBT8310904.1 hypothetical protein [Bacteroidia bacterium]NND10468.1 hypothetical protein [Flavobacteriaceae bacterium]NNK27929.1 hypothetical protein [Flavobacteriaceae bacterium]NNL60132.1 hypothetical protein [Flavobacteriaceae bacterium]
MSDKSIEDDEKQKLLLQQISKQFVLLGKLVFGIFLFVAPFLSLFLLETFSPELNPNILVTWWGLLIPVVTVVFYILFKRHYGKLFRNR